MSYTMIPDDLMDSPEMLNCSRSARQLLFEGYNYCNRHLTDGSITRAQWRRATDTEDLDAELEELVAAGLVERKGAAYQLPWTHQSTRARIMDRREQKRQDNERREQALKLHRDGDHHLCTHEGGGRHRPRKSSPGKSTGHTPGGLMDSPLDASPSPSPSPSRNSVEGGDGGPVAGIGSAGAPPAVLTDPRGRLGRRTAAPSEPYVDVDDRPAVADPDGRGRILPGGELVTAADLGGVDPMGLTQTEIENILCA